MYVAKHKQTKKCSEFTWTPTDELTIGGEVVNRNDYEIIEVDEDALIDRVIEEIKADIKVSDVSAIFELLRFCPVENLIQYLPEEEWKNFK
jgi:hypothetical protein